MPAATDDRYLGLVAAGWVLALTVPLGAVPIAFLLLERRPGHGWTMLAVCFLELAVFLALVVRLAS